jgi:hypothetical protein
MKSPIHERALLASLSLALFSPNKTDKRLTSHVLADNHASKGTLRVAKKLLPEDAVKPLRELHGEIRDFHYKHTLPWGEDNERLLSAAAFLSYNDAMRDFRTRHENLAETFVRDYPTYVDAAKIALNGAFDPDDYPDQQTIAGKFRMRLDFKPLPDGADFRISVMKEAMAELHESVAARVAEATAAARSAEAARLADPLVRLIARLNDSEAVFRDTLVDNVREIVDLFPSLDVTADPGLRAVHARMRAELYHADPDTLRNNATVRASTARKAQGILDTMQDYFGDGDPLAQAA